MAQPKASAELNMQLRAQEKLHSFTKRTELLPGVLWLTVTEDHTMSPNVRAKQVGIYVHGVIEVAMDKATLPQDYLPEALRVMREARDQNLPRGVKAIEFQHDGDPDTVVINGKTRRITLRVIGTLTLAVSRPTAKRTESGKKGTARIPSRDTDHPRRVASAR